MLILQRISHRSAESNGRSGAARSLAAACAALALGAGSAARAARPMLTDDARVVDEKACQVETWAKRNRHDTERWALPACNFGGDSEFTLGGAVGSDARGSTTTDVVAQVKHVFTPLREGGWGRGVALGYVAHPAIDPSANLLGDAYGYLLNSYALRGGRSFVHTNLGWVHERATHSDRLTWGVGLEHQVASRVFLVAEAYGRDVGRPWYQAGVRVWLVPDRIQIDTTLGNRFGSRGEERWLSFGLRLLSPAFLP